MTVNTRCGARLGTRRRAGCSGNFVERGGHGSQPGSQRAHPPADHRRPSRTFRLVRGSPFDSVRPKSTCLGCFGTKWRPVQIRPPRPEGLSRSLGISEHHRSGVPFLLLRRWRSTEQLPPGEAPPGKPEPSAFRPRKAENAAQLAGNGRSPSIAQAVSDPTAPTTTPAAMPMRSGPIHQARIGAGRPAGGQAGLPDPGERSGGGHAGPGHGHRGLPAG